MVPLPTIALPLTLNTNVTNTRLKWYPLYSNWTLSGWFLVKETLSSHISHSLYRGSLHTSQISHLLQYPSLWLLALGLCSHFFFQLFHIQPTFEVSALVGNILEKWLHDFVCFGNPCLYNTLIAKSGHLWVNEGEVLHYGVPIKRGVLWALEKFYHVRDIFQRVGSSGISYPWGRFHLL